MQIQGSVGGGGRNDRRDVYLVQIMLNVWRQSRKLTEIAEDGRCGPQTVRAIEEFQKTTGWVDGRVDVGGRTFRALQAFAQPYLVEATSLIAIGFASSYVSTITDDDEAQDLPVSEAYLLREYSFRQRG
ncbi:MAG: hypothetical protein KGM15_05660 [Pseudomonadota bacterium]|nr:hypothetical protein [Pseudomonadota bacterium]